MTANRQELLAAVCAAPDDDGPRHAYADAIAPYDADRAAFIRMQLDRAAAERTARAPRGEERPEEVLWLHQHAAEWTQYLKMFIVPTTDDTHDPGYTFERGFVARVRVSIDNVMGLGPRLFQMAPIQHLDVAPGEPPLSRLFGLRALDHLDSLSLVGLGLDDDDAAAMASCEALARATWIDLSGNKIGRRGVEALARARMMANKVRVLMLDNPCNPVESPRYDWDGSIASMSGNGDADAMEQAIGAVPWFHFPWASRAGMPDRFHAKYAPRAP